MENIEARVSDPFYVYQKFTSSEELKNAIRQHVVEIRREIDFTKNDKNRVRAICKGTIPDLGQLDSCKPSQSNKESEENKCLWVLYASKWEQDVDWEIKTYEKEHRCLQTTNVKACTYKFLAKKIV
uniref:Transposase MuDR plant domain-containing protein n=1 Tax=Lactuca sativa TaxID=4236 RepID=A0A9R1VKD2_LACSA|nr:hypothetical protein LSAT_V11C500259950 [Lactuca sativa]